MASFTSGALNRALFSSVASPILGFSSAVTLAAGGGYTFTNAEAEALVARFATPPTNSRKELIDTLVGSLKTAGVWSKLDALYVMAAADEQAAQRNWVADQYNLTPVNAPTFTPDVGYQGNGTNQKLTTGFNAATATTPKFVQDSAHAAIWSATDLANGAGSSNDFGQVGSTVSYISRSNSTPGLARIRPNTGSTVNGSSGGYIGLIGWSRNASNEWKAYRNGVATATGTTVSAALPSSAFEFLASFGGYGVNQLSLGCFGGELSDAEFDALYDAVAAYLDVVLV